MCSLVSCQCVKSSESHVCGTLFPKCQRCSFPHKRGGPSREVSRTFLPLILIGFVYITMRNYLLHALRGTSSSTSPWSSSISLFSLPTISHRRSTIAVLLFFLHFSFIVVLHFTPDFLDRFRVQFASLPLSRRSTFEMATPIKVITGLLALGPGVLGLPQLVV